MFIIVIFKKKKIVTTTSQNGHWKAFCQTFGLDCHSLSAGICLTGRGGHLMRCTFCVSIIMHWRVCVHDSCWCFRQSFQWTDESSMNNLQDVHQLYCPSKRILAKETRNIFVKGSMEEVREKYQVRISRLIISSK